MSMFLRKKWLLPSILNFVDPKPQEPSAQILSFLEQPGDKSGNVVVLLSDRFNYIGAVLLKESLIEYKKDNPGYSDLRSLKGGIIALIDYNFKPDKNWTNIVIEIEKFNFICNSEPVGEPALITKDDVAEVLKIYKRGGKDDDDNNHSLSQASQLVEMADLLSQVDDSVNQSIRRTSKADQEEMDLSESDFIIPEDQRKQLDRIPGWVDEELSQAPPSQVASVNASLLPSVSQSVHKSPAKAPTEFYQGQPPLQLAVDASIEDSEEGNQSKDQDQMNIEKDVLGDNLQQAGDVAEAINGATPSKNDSTKVDETFDEETQGPEELANIQTQSLPMTLSTGDLAKSAEKPAAETATANEEQNKAKETKKKKKSDKAKDSKKKKEKPAASESEPVEAASSQKSTGETSKSNRSTRSKKKTAKNSVSQSTGENATGEKTTEKPKSKKKSDKAKEGTQDKRTDKAEDKTKDKKEKKKKEKKSKKDKKDKKKKRKSATESSSGTASSNNTSLAAPEPTPGQEAQPVATEQLEQPPAAQPAVGKPAEVPVLTTTEIIDNASILIQETVVLHDQHVEHEKDPNKIYDEQNRTIPNLNDEDMDSMMMSFHQELESASQLDLNAVPDYIVEVSPDKSSYPIIRDLGSPLITSHTSSQAASSQQGGLHFGHSNQEFSLGMPSDASSQARNVAPSQAVVDAVNNNNVNNASEGSEDNAGKSSSSISQELISGTMRNVSPEKAQPEAPAKEKHSLLEEMLMSDPAEANNITDSQVDNTDGAEYFTQHPDLLGDSESQWEGARAPATQGVVPVVPQSQGDLHSEFFSSSDDSGKDKQSQNSGQNAKTTEPKDTENVTPTTSPTSKKDSISPKARRHLEFNLDKDAPNSPTKSQPVSTSQHSSNRFKFSLPKPATANPQKRINLSTQPQTQLPRVIATSPPKFKRPAAKSPPKDNAPVQPSVNTNSPTKTAPKAQSSPEKRSVPEKEIEKGVEQEVAVDNSFEEEDSDLEITSEQRPPDDSPPPLIRVNSTNLREEGEVQRPRERSRSKSPSPGESKSKSREEKDDTKLKYVIDLEDLSPRFFNKTKKATDNNTNKVVRSRDKSNSGSGLSSQETTVSPQNRTPSAVVKKANINKKSPSPNSRPGSLGDLIRQSRQQSLASKDPTMEFVIGYFKEVTSEPKAAPAVRAPRFSPNANSNNNGSGSTAGVKRKIDYYGWLDLTSNKKRKLDHNDNKK